MPLRYVAGLKLPAEGAISAIAFSHTGNFVACATLLGKVMVWDTHTGTQLYVVRAKSPVLCLAWSTFTAHNVLCGLENGTVASISFDDDALSISGFAAHESILECIALTSDDTKFATAGQEEVRVWNSRGVWHRVSELGPPPSNGQTARSLICVTSVQWLSRMREADCLLVSYMHHGVIMWDVDSQTVLRAMPISTSIGAASLSPDQQHLAISNLCTGFDLYRIATNAPFATLPHKMGPNYATPVLFVHNGRAVLGGNASGEVSLWDVETGRRLHLLTHAGQSPFPSAAFDCFRDRFLLATGAVGSLGESYVQLWHTEEIREKPFMGYDKRKAEFLQGTENTYYEIGTRPTLCRYVSECDLVTVIE
ncbi:WD40 repeat-like protein [Artomyces pyxidatus]|uniref:WD40 repeat-like protein n=1 Tax=Artomyces pyxidatus TaxID=48021 RepID=A0ACB8SHY4_9AGAM|nr:WD40 repeat-like protein [Artomyces pyxidatus]